MITKVNFFVANMNLDVFIKKFNINNLLQNREYDFKHTDFLINGQECKNENDLYDHCFNKLNFPNYFGRNWDALEDCLSDFSWFDSLNLKIYVTHIQDFMAENTNGKEIFFDIILKLLSIIFKIIEVDSSKKCFH